VILPLYVGIHRLPEALPYRSQTLRLFEKTCVVVSIGKQEQLSVL
jgi:hypothetical protein